MSQRLQNIILKNKGYGGGGINTNFNGKKFEERTSSFNYLINKGYIKKSMIKNPRRENDYFLFKKYKDKVVIYLSQISFKRYMKYKYNIDVFRYPDEGFVLEYQTGEIVVKILEKKNQNVNGSIETKLWSGPSLKREYELVLGEKFKVEYAFCVNHFLKLKLTSEHKKYITLKKILSEAKIIYLYGDDNDYFKHLYKWFNSSL